ncbi:efflux RND transporter periplasmic adaptor subunit [Acerihabitans arboris]|uniref:Efflux RND transporter periplasmic adaptor subunit n=1 Tax=Acerihabitans arboris TaxID=2691583 RepID=A0A845SL19_9GAMM|nr:efflux RND transporter periplasmic adaptor subunit [Acerihabitans arboris]NDL63686.1 efflux RND transporter periplasmic adaptor subunit [Acerihabitans arboris]
MHRKIAVISLILLLSACDRNSSAENQAAPPPVSVNVVTLRTQPVTLSTRLPGRTTAVKSAEVRPQVSGIILKRLFTEGAEVKAGQQLYQIDPATYQAAYDRARATFDNANAVVRRYKPLSEAHAISGQLYDDAVATAKEAAADMETARVNLNYTKVIAPISGHIGRSLSTEGALVTSGQSAYLTTIQQLDPIYVDVSESSQNLLQLRKALAQGHLKAAGDNAAAARLTLEDGGEYAHEGKLQFSEVTVDEGTGSVTMRAVFPNGQNELLPGMFVHAVLQQGVQENGILVPQESVGHDIKGAPYVMVVTADGAVEQRAIGTGEMINGQWLVTKGLAAGERVITDGLQNVRAGAKVTAAERPAATVAEIQNKSSMTDSSAQ